MYTIIGLEHTQYEKNGRTYSGTRIHSTYDKPNMDGLAVEAVYCNSSVDLTDLSIGDLCEIYYNKYGKVSHVKKVG